ncbi:hypothetical protein GOBAR_AA23833 [Gossypium barbadense]|uniref:SWIM-type domain-containing protein n=1 Tax=Gossypium barbadense TaxID=3634 RepID=A0A2P5X0I3_GOSBA|nr:hypothetical protein GOBAR_AA23833 [Gossypium barbadense]
MLVNNLSESFNKMILEAIGKPILTMMETVRTKIMLLIVKKKEKANKWKGTLCPKIKKKLDVNIKDSLSCVPSHAGGDKYQVECGLGSQHVVDLVQNSCSYRNWDLTGIPCMHALAVIHVKNEFPETYVQTWHTKQTQIQIYSNFVKKHQVGVRTQQQATPSQQEGTPTQQGALTQIPTAPTHQEAASRQKLPLKRKSTTTTVR